MYTLVFGGATTIISYVFLLFLGPTGILKIAKAHPDVTTTSMIVDLLKFEAEKDGTKIKVTWKTAKEMNCDFFTIEQSNNKTEWNEISKIQSTNCNEITEYHAIDHHPYGKTIFYRLKQTDLLGFSTYSNIIKVKLKDPSSKNYSGLPANTSNNDCLKLRLSGLKGKNLIVKIKNSKGREMHAEKIFVSKNKERIIIAPDTKLEDGRYIVYTFDNDRIVSRQTVIKN